MDINGIALIIGGGSGIGKACAIGFAKYGARAILIGDQDLDAALDTATASRAVAAHSSTFRAEAMVVDVTLAESVDRILEYMVQSFGRVDYCVTTAGISGPVNNEFADVDEAVFKQVQDVNVGGTFLIDKKVSAVMRMQEPRLVDAGQPKRGLSRGAIVNMGSVASHFALPQSAQYVASKHAVVGLTRAAALDNMKHGIRVNCLCPSHVDTRMMRQIFAAEPTSEQAIVASQPMGRMALAEEIADAVIFLCSPRASWITGSNLVIDGGLSLTCG